MHRWPANSFLILNKTLNDKRNIRLMSQFVSDFNSFWPENLVWRPAKLFDVNWDEVKTSVLTSSKSASIKNMLRRQNVLLTSKSWWQLSMKWVLRDLQTASFPTRSDVFGCVHMDLDMFRCVSEIWKAWVIVINRTLKTFVGAFVVFSLWNVMGPLQIVQWP